MQSYTEKKKAHLGTDDQDSFLKQVKEYAGFSIEKTVPFAHVTLICLLTIAVTSGTTMNSTERD